MFLLYFDCFVCVKFYYTGLKFQTEIKKLNVSDEEDETLEQLDMLIGYFEKRQKLMVEFEELAFESIVDKIVVKNQNELEFHLIGGLELTEKICS